MARLIFLCLLLGFCTKILSMSYMPIPFEKQLQESYGVIEGSYISHEYKKLEDQIVTVYTFSVEKFIGFSKNEILSPKNFQIMVPGGNWQNEIFHVEGVPRFQKNENLVVLVKKGAKGGFWPSHLGLGKYVIVEKDRKKFLTSSVFPGHPHLGSIEYSEYVNLVNKTFGKRLSGFQQGKTVFLQDESVLKGGPKRGPASDQVTPQSRSSEQLSIVWILVIFIIVGSFGMLMARKQR